MQKVVEAHDTATRLLAVWKFLSSLLELPESEPWLSSALFAEDWLDCSELPEWIVVEVTDVLEDEVGTTVVLEDEVGTAVVLEDEF